MDTTRDAPRVIIFPPLVPVLAIVLAAVLQRLSPLVWLSHATLTWRLPLGAALLLAGVALMASGRRSLTKAGTNVHPSQPALVLVESGIYRWTRNPLYVGGCLAMVGISILFTLAWLALIFPLSVVVLHFGIIKPEEGYLERKFGDEYRSYKLRVRRYF